MKSIIVNADDLGCSSVVNEAIIDCIQKGLITSTTIMANGEAFDDVKSIAAYYSQISFGVHLVIDEYKSLTNSKVLEEYGIVDRHGYFIKSAIKYVRIDKRLKEAVYKEWDAQISKIEEAGISLSHIDSHHHFHTIPELADIVISLAKKHGIEKIRQNSRRPLFLPFKKVKANVPNEEKELMANKRHHNLSFISKVKNRILSEITYNRFRHRLITTDFFCSVSQFVENQTVLEHNKSIKTIELMCHPGHPSYLKETDSLKTLFESYGDLYINYLQL